MNQENFSHTPFAAFVIGAKERARTQPAQQGRPCCGRISDESAKPAATTAVIGIVDRRFTK
jgi:hypothetical protein